MRIARIKDAIRQHWACRLWMAKGSLSTRFYNIGMSEDSPVFDTLYGLYGWLRSRGRGSSVSERIQHLRKLREVNDYHHQSRRWNNRHAIVDQIRKEEREG